MAKPKIESIFPLTLMQQALLFHSIHEKDDQGFLHVQCTLQGNLQVAWLEQAFVKTVQRHPALRTSIHWEKIKKPVQIVHPTAAPAWVHHDWRQVPSGQYAEKMEALKTADREQGFELSVPPLSRLALIRLQDEEYYLLWSCHHILLDGWSAAIILKDVLAHYDAISRGGEAALEALPSYRSYLNWLQQQDLEQPRAFWRNALAGFEEPSLMGTHQAGANGSPGAFSDHSFVLTAGATAQLQSYARRHRLTLTTVIQGAWAILLGRFLDHRDVAFGTTVSGRTASIPNLERMAGLFMNVLPVSAQLQPKMPVAVWLQELQQRQMEARNFEYVGLDQIAAWTNWPGGRPLFDTLLVVENFPWSDLNGGNIRLQDFTGGFTSTYPVSLIVKPGEQLEFQIRYQQQRISERAVPWLAKNLPLLLESISDPSKELVSELAALVDRPAFKAAGRKAGIKNGKNGQNGFANGLKEGDYVAPRNTLELKLTEIWEEVFGRHPIGITEDFFYLGGSSLLAVRLFALIEKKLGRNLPPVALLQHRTIESLAGILKNEELQNWDSLVPVRAGGSRPPLFCVHAGGAHVFFYHAMARHLGAAQPVYALQPTGLDGRAAYHATVEEMAAHYVQEIRKVQPEGPYALLGTCFGNAVCLEMAKQLQAMGQAVSLLAIIDSAVVDLELVSKPDAKKQLERVPLRYRRFIERLRKNPGKAILAIFQARMTRLRIAMEKKFNFLRSRQTRSLYSVQKNLLQLHLQYEWQPFDGKVTLIRSSESDENPNLDYHVTQWAKLAKGGLDVFVVPGRHETLFEEPEVQQLAGQLNKSLNQMEGASKVPSI